MRCRQDALLLGQRRQSRKDAKPWLSANNRTVSGSGKPAEEPKGELYIDNGRRWLIAHPNEKFDAIVMNTTYHFREHASSLLSEDFLQIIRLHLNPGGIHYSNTARSDEVLRTGATVFPYSMRFFNFVALSDSPFQIDHERWRKVLASYQIDGKPVSLG